MEICVRNSITGCEVNLLIEYDATVASLTEQVAQAFSLDKQHIALSFDTITTATTPDTRLCDLNITGDSIVTADISCESYLADLESGRTLWQFLPEWVRSLKEAALRAVAYDVSIFDDLPAPLRNDVDVLSQIIPTKADKLMQCSDEIRDDPAVLSHFLKKPGNIRFCGPKSRGNKELLMAAINNGVVRSTLLCMTAPAVNDRVFALECCAMDGVHLEFFSAVVRGDPEVVQCAVQQNPYAIIHAGDTIKGDRSYISTLIAEICSRAERYAVTRNSVVSSLVSFWDRLFVPTVDTTMFRRSGRVIRLLEHFPMYADDTKIVEKCCDLHAECFSFASDRLRGDVPLALQCVTASSSMLAKVALPAAADHSVIKKAVRSFPSAVVHIHCDVLSKPLALELVRTSFEVFRHLPATFQEDRDIALVAVRDSRCATIYSSLCTNLKMDADLAIVAVTQNNASLRHVSKIVFSDRSFMLIAIEKDPLLLEQHSEFNDDREVVMKAVSTSGDTLRYASKRLKGDKEVVAKASPHALQYASEELQNDKKLMLKAISGFPYILKACKETRLGEDRDFVLAAVKVRGTALHGASEALQDDDEVVRAAMQQDASAFRDASKRLRANRTLAIAAIAATPMSLYFLEPPLRDDEELKYLATKTGRSWLGAFGRYHARVGKYKAFKN